jgi:methionyl aminopeptidase
LRKAGRTADINAFVAANTKARGAVPSQLGYHGIPAVVCTSRNDVVCHGIPSAEEILNDGDILNIDVTSHIGGFHGDRSRTFTIGMVSPKAAHVVDVARRCLLAGSGVVRHGARLGEIRAAIVELTAKEGCSVVRDFGGHGIGRRLHTDPHVPHVGSKGKGLRLVEGMCLTVEPMINLGRPQVKILSDGWTAVTRDRSLSAQFEHSVGVTETGHEIFTLSPKGLSPPRQA